MAMRNRVRDEDGRMEVIGFRAAPPEVRAAMRAGRERLYFGGGDRIEALPEGGLLGVLASAGDYLAESRLSEMDPVQRALQRLGVAQGIADWLQTTGRGDRTTLEQDAFAALDAADLGTPLASGARRAAGTVVSALPPVGVLSERLYREPGVASALAQRGAVGGDRADRIGAGVGKSKRRVGTTGRYVGAPAGVNSPQALARMRQNYIDTVERGVDGADWYDDSSAWIQQVVPEGMIPQHLADALSVTSSGTGVDPNLGFVIKAANQNAAGMPVSTGRFPSSQSPQVEQALRGQEDLLGPKREPFAANLSVGWDPNIQSRSVHDIWDGRAFGYTDKNGKPWSAGFSPQQHAFMDEEMDVIIPRLNERAIGGRTDWAPHNAQAAAWTGQKIAAGSIAPEDAAKHFGSFSPKYVASATHEQAPAAGIGHMEGLLDLPYEERLAYQMDPRSSWVNDRGQDRIYSSLGMLTEPSNRMVGAYTPSGGALEINPGEVARPLVQMEDAGGKMISPRDRQLLDIGESSRAFIDAQNAGAWHKVVPGAKAGQQDSLFVSLDQNPDPETMAALSDLATRNGMFAVDTGQGISLINDPFSEIGAKRTGASLGKELKKGPLASELRELVGDAPIERAKIDTGYLDYEDAWRAGPGSGQATERFLGMLDQNEAVMRRLEPVLREKAAANMARDADMGALFQPREDIQNARKILAEQGIEGLRKALRSGAVLPAAASALILPELVQRRNDGALMERP